MRKRKQKISSYNPLIEEDKDFILPIVQQPKEKVAKEKFKASGHLTDQLLKYNYPKEGGQLSIFDSLTIDTKKEIEVAEVEESQIVEGVKLTASETKVIDNLCKLLHYKSQNTEQNNSNYYSGNDAEIVRSKEGEIAPKLSFTLYELAKEYSNSEAPSGKIIENVKDILLELDQRKFLFKYKQVTKGKKGEEIIKEIEGFRPLINVDKATLTYKVNGIEEYKKSETVITLNPIFRNQIDSKFILYPVDHRSKLQLANGSPKIPEITETLYKYLVREHSSKRYTPQIGYEKLTYLVAEKWIKESRNKKVREGIERAIDTLQKIELIKGCNRDTNSKGEIKLVFTLNKDWE